MRDRGRAVRVCTLVLAAGCDRGTAPGARPAPTYADTTVMPQRTVVTPPDPSTDDDLVTAAVARVTSAHAPGTAYALLLSVGEGERATRAADRLRAMLSREAGVVFSTVQRAQGGPVADPGTPGGHVNTEGYVVTPPPALVLRVSESGGRLYIAARSPGSDPLGPPDNGWAWVLPNP